MCGARGSSVGVVEYLVEAVESLNGDATDSTGATALHHAAMAGNPAVITAICNIPKIEINATDKKGQAPIHYACAEGRLEAVEVLIGLGVDVDAQDNEGNTPLHVATRTRHTWIAQLLLEAGANTELTDLMGFTPVHVAANQGCNCLNFRLQSPMHIAAEMGGTKICETLLRAGANIEQREQSGKTPLYIAARGSFTTIVDMIIKTARLDYPTPAVPDLTPARRRWREGSRGGSASSSNSEFPEKYRLLLFKLAYKQLGPEDWKKLAHHWAFTDDQIKAIEHEYTGPLSYEQHGYRMLQIWASGLKPEVPLTKELCDALIAVDKKVVAESIRKQLEKEKNRRFKSHKQRCHKCSIT